ncbi:hypothetical protein AXF42_Ash019214 [Apostasia shenzhenica]|uniref:Uncharacterized protein n=1 Tax=Apostasia shenzhenica TaxID=1088818 RepID=A0A2I0A2Y5_9ASPA|nr:hypothetical protein AXF42_Ash019214 [Apostasia shenzhenica]
MRSICLQIQSHTRRVSHNGTKEKDFLVQQERLKDNGWRIHDNKGHGKGQKLSFERILLTPEVAEEGIISKQPDLASKNSTNVEITPKSDSQSTVHYDKVITVTNHVKVPFSFYSCRYYFFLSKRIRRNKEHPSQSKKNYKAPCGSGERKPSAVVIVYVYFSLIILD